MQNSLARSSYQEFAKLRFKRKKKSNIENEKQERKVFQACTGIENQQKERPNHALTLIS